MSERYSRLFLLHENIYSIGAPVIIAAGALLKDNQTDKVLTQLKIRNIQDRMIKAVTVRIVPLDTRKVPLGDTVDYQYLDLTATRDTEFGQKIPVDLPDATTRAFSVSVMEVIFSDNDVWKSSDADGIWESVPAPIALEKEFSDIELVKQYKQQYGADCKCIFKKEKDLWWCACGALNHDFEATCHSCQKEAAALAALDIDKLQADCNQRLLEERKQAAKEKAIAEIQAKKRRKLAILAALLFVAISIPVIGINFYRKNEPYRNVDHAIQRGEFSVEWVEQNELTELLQFKAISDNLNRYQEQDDFVSAMELITVLYESGISLERVDKESDTSISSSFVLWATKIAINEAKRRECVLEPKRTYLTGGSWAISQNSFYNTYYLYDSLGYDFRCEDADGNGNLDNIELYISNTEKIDKNMPKGTYKKGNYRLLGRLSQAIKVEQSDFEFSDTSNAPFDNAPKGGLDEEELAERIEIFKASIDKTIRKAIANANISEADISSENAIVVFDGETFEGEEITITGTFSFFVAEDECTYTNSFSATCDLALMVDGSTYVLEVDDTSGVL